MYSCTRTRPAPAPPPLPAPLCHTECLFVCLTSGASCAVILCYECLFVCGVVLLVYVQKQNRQNSFCCVQYYCRIATIQHALKPFCLTTTHTHTQTLSRILTLSTCRILKLKPTPTTTCSKTSEIYARIHFRELHMIIWTNDRRRVCVREKERCV